MWKVGSQLQLEAAAQDRAGQKQDISQIQCKWSQTIELSCPVKAWLSRASNKPVTLWTRASCLIIFDTINIWTVVERSISFPHWSPTSLVQIVPVETGKWTMVCTSTLKKIWALLCPKLLQVSDNTKQDKTYIWYTRCNTFISIFNTSLWLQHWTAIND